MDIFVGGPFLNMSFIEGLTRKVTFEQKYKARMSRVVT